MARIIFGIGLILLGLSSLLGSWIFKIIFAAFLIVLGVKIIISPNNTRWHCRYGTGVMNECTQDTLDETIVFGSLCKKIISEHVKGGKITIVFGGGVLDLREVKSVEKNIDLEITTVLGGLKLLVPHNWSINIKNTSVLGGCDNRTRTEEADVQLNISGSTILGGIQLMN